MPLVTAGSENKTKVGDPTTENRVYCNILIVAVCLIKRFFSPKLIIVGIAYLASAWARKSYQWCAKKDALCGK